MTCSLRTLLRALFACLCIFSFTSSLRAQGPVDVQLPGPWPTGWTGCGCTPTNGDAFQILYTAGVGYPCQIPDAALRLTIGGCNSPIFGQLGVIDSLHDPFFHLGATEWFSAFAPVDATVLRSSEGDLILSATTFAVMPTHGPVPLTASIRFGTTPSDTLSTNADHPAEIERMVINGNGNVGIDLPPTLTSGLDSAADQVQIGGGMVAPLGYVTPIPGLTIYGGNRFEGRPDTGGTTFPVDWRYISFNDRIDHSDPSSNRFSRIAPMSSSSLGFSDIAGGLIEMNTYPFDSSRGMHDFTHGVTLTVTGQVGLSMTSYENDSDQYHHLFDVYRPSALAYGITRNTNGMFIHHTPVYICSDTSGERLADFMNLTNIHPDLGDDTTWDLAVNGPALFKEAWVNSSDWPDYVLQPDYHLMSIEEFGSFLARNHHLPDLPPAKTMNAGIPLGKTEADLTKQVEELSLYIVQLNKEVEALKTEVQGLKKGGK